MPRQQCPFTIDPTGRDLRREALQLRDRGPVVKIVLPGGVEGWAVTEPELIKQLLIDPRISKDAHQHWPAWIGGQIDDSWPMSMWVSVRNMLTAHGAEHARLRRLVAGAFTNRRTAGLRSCVEDTAEGLLDGIAALPLELPVDLRRKFAHPLPIRVIGTMLGVPGVLHRDLQTMVTVLFQTSATPEEAQANQHKLYTVLSELIATKRAEPGDDLTSALIEERDGDQGTGLSEKELLDTLLLVIGAGFETTVNLIEQATHAMLTHPDQLELVRSGTATWNDVIDETLRHRGVVANIPFRFAVEDIHAADTLIPAGTPIVLSLVAAGRDVHQHGPDADRFDLTRPTRRSHVAFGHGVHHCLGQPLARLEASIALDMLFTRFPTMSLAVPQDRLRPIESFISSGHTSLPVLLGQEATS